MNAPPKRIAPRREIAGEASDVKRASASLGDLVSPTAPKTSATGDARTRKRHFYKPLPKEFQRDGFIFKRIAREGDIAIYQQTWDGCPNPSIAYEVIRIRRREGFQIDGRFVKPAEVYPKSEAWGVDGFTLTDKDAAFAKLRELA